MYEFEINGIRVLVVVINKPKNKNTYIRYNNNIIKITTPQYLTAKDIQKMLTQNVALVEKIMAKENQNTETLHIFGVPYKVVINEGTKNFVTKEGDTLYISVTKKIDMIIQRTIKVYYITLTEEYIREALPKITSQFDDLDLSDVRYYFKYVKSFFGKCYRSSRMIFFSGLCAKYEQKYIDYIIYHELAHLKYAGHQADFHRYLQSKLPQSTYLKREIGKIRYNDLI